MRLINSQLQDIASFELCKVSKIVLIDLRCLRDLAELPELLLNFDVEVVDFVPEKH